MNRGRFDEKTILAGRRYAHRRNSPTRTRTLNLAINSRSLYRLSYRGISPSRISGDRARLKARSALIGRMGLSPWTRPGWGERSGVQTWAGGLRLVLLDRLLQEADDERVEGGLVFLGPTGELLVECGWHANLEMDNSLGHGCTSSWLGLPVSGAPGGPVRRGCTRRACIEYCILKFRKTPRLFSLRWAGFRRFRSPPACAGVSRRLKRTRGWPPRRGPSAADPGLQGASNSPDRSRRDVEPTSDHRAAWGRLHARIAAIREMGQPGP